VFASLSAHIYQHPLISLPLCLLSFFQLLSLFDQGVKLKGYSNEPVFASLSAFPAHSYLSRPLLVKLLSNVVFV
jgi:hypothetical protein